MSTANATKLKLIKKHPLDRWGVGHSMPMTSCSDLKWEKNACEQPVWSASLCLGLLVHQLICPFPVCLLACLFRDPSVCTSMSNSCLSTHQSLPACLAVSVSVRPSFHLSVCLPPVSVGLSVLSANVCVRACPLWLRLVTEVTHISSVMYVERYNRHGDWDIDGVWEVPVVVLWSKFLVKISKKQEELWYKQLSFLWRACHSDNDIVMNFLIHPECQTRNFIWKLIDTPVGEMLYLCHMVTSNFG